MVALPSPSAEQQSVLDIWRERRHQTCTAAAGSGKSTLLLHAAAAADGEETLIIAYNRPLASEMTDALRSVGLDHARCFTFHGLASHVFELAPDDAALEDIVERAEAGELTPRVHLHPKRVCVDEAQDFRPLHLRLLRVAFDASDAVFLVVGDARQLLYTYVIPPASAEYMQNPSTHFASGVWTDARLTVSFRLTAPNAAFANGLLDGKHDPVVPGNGCDDPVQPTVFSCGTFEWSRVIPDILERCGAREHPERVAILVRSTRATDNASLATLVNELTRRGWPVYVNGVDGADSRVRTGKIMITTWHSGKGTQYDTVVVCGVCATSEIEPLHVAVTRAKHRLYVVQNDRAPRASVLATVNDGLAVAGDDRTLQLAADPPPPPPEWKRPNTPRDMTSWRPCGSTRDAERHVELVRSSEAPYREDALPSEILVRVAAGAYEDVTDLYVTAALFFVEAQSNGGTPALMSDMLTPQRASRTERTKRQRNGDRRRSVDTRASEDDLLPAHVWTALRGTASDGHTGGHGRNAQRSPRTRTEVFTTALHASFPSHRGPTRACSKRLSHTCAPRSAAMSRVPSTTTRLSWMRRARACRECTLWSIRSHGRWCTPTDSQRHNAFAHACQWRLARASTKQVW
jgi:hypothetical protein